MKYILIIWFYHNGQGNFDHIEFNSRRACEGAASAVIHASPYRKVTTECLAKGKLDTD